MSIVRNTLLGAGLALALACGSESQPTPPAARPAPAPAPKPAPTPKPEPAPAASDEARDPDVAAGAVLYSTYCASCHGPGGKGDGPLAATLEPKPADHTDSAYMASLTNDQLFQVIKEGGAAVGKSPLMAPWGGTLSDAEIRDVMAYVRTLSGT